LENHEKCGNQSFKGGIMFTVSEKAREKVKEFFKDRQELSPIRIVKTSG
jgi:hypothetical protein